jgi:hypothetical protein
MNTVDEQNPSREKELQPNPGVPTPESVHGVSEISTQSAPQTADIPTTIPAPDPNPEAMPSENDNLTATDMNPIEERAASQNTKYMVIIAVVAVVVIVLALLYMWGSRVAQEQLTTSVPEDGAEMGVDEPTSSELPSAPVTPPQQVTELDMPQEAQDIVALPELSEIDAEFAALEAELDALLAE